MVSYCVFGREIAESSHSAPDSIFRRGRRDYRNGITLLGNIR
jgi:hypothetical protein